jgi:hypothetical protein
MKGSIDIPTGASRTRWDPWLRPRLSRQRANSDREKGRSKEGQLGVGTRERGEGETRTRKNKKEEEGEGGIERKQRSKGMRIDNSFKK